MNIYDDQNGFSINVNNQTDITELNDIDYSLKVEFYEDGERYQEIMVIGFKIKDYEVYARVF
jgi:hypothetical protein